MSTRTASCIRIGLVHRHSCQPTASLLQTLVTFLYGLYCSSQLHALPESVRGTVQDALGRPLAVTMAPVIDFAPFTLFLGIVMFALAIAFQKRLDLKQEQSLTV